VENPELVASLHIERAFGLGLLLVMDRDSSEVLELTSALVSASSSGLAIKVHHAADVDLAGYSDDDVIPLAQVEVDVHVGPGAPSDVLYRGSIDVPSGVVTVGDADREDRLEVEPGQWDVQIICNPADEHAEKVLIWLQPS
jgi:hypothetical protein